MSELEAVWLRHARSSIAAILKQKPHLRYSADYPWVLAKRIVSLCLNQSRSNP
jgi:hypothetical protein